MYGLYACSRGVETLFFWGHERNRVIKISQSQKYFNAYIYCLLLGLTENELLDSLFASSQYLPALGTLDPGSPVDDAAGDAHEVFIYICIYVYVSA